MDQRTERHLETERGITASRRAFMAGTAAGVAAHFALGGRAAYAQQPAVPAYYPPDYESVIEGSRRENGNLSIYSNISDANWRYIIAEFRARFPWVTRLRTNNLGNAEVFQRYYNEIATNVRACDVIVNSGSKLWHDFAIARQAQMPYESPEKAHLPATMSRTPGLYTLATEPMVMAYNKMLLPAEQRPRGIAHLAELVRANAARFQGKLTSFTIEEAVGFDLNWMYIQKAPGAWESLEAVLPQVRPEVSSGPGIEKLTSGECLAGYFVSLPILRPRLRGGVENIIGWNFIEEGQPLIARTAAIPKESTNVNTAKLFLDFLISHEGQVAAARSGMTPVRADITPAQSELSYQRMGAVVGGESKLFQLDFDSLPDAAQEQEMRTRWRRALGR